MSMHVNLSLSMFYSWTYGDYRVWQDDSLLFVGRCCRCASCVVTANPPLWVTQLWFVLREAVGFSGQQPAIAAAVQPRQHPHVFLTVPLHPVHCIMMALLQPAGKLLVAGRGHHSYHVGKCADSACYTLQGTWRRRGADLEHLI